MVRSQIEDPITVQFLDSPPLRKTRSNARYDWPAIATLLKQNRGRWAIVLRQVPRSHASAIKNGKIAALRPPQHYEVVTRNGNGSRGDLVMRYVGPMEG